MASLNYFLKKGLLHKNKKNAKKAANQKKLSSDDFGE
jgi:hypothetical protein